MDSVRMLFDGYDTGTLYADHYIGKILESLAAVGTLDETVIMIGADQAIGLNLPIAA